MSRMLVSLALFLTIGAACAATQEQCMTSLHNESVTGEQSDFHAEMSRFLAAVTARDRKTFEEYFDPRISVTALLPGGKVFADLSSFLKSQDGWFSGTTGKFEATIQRTDASGDLGFLWAKATYSNTDDGGPFALGLYITFVFRRLEGRWYLTHDQNSVVSDSRK